MDQAAQQRWFAKSLLQREIAEEKSEAAVGNRPTHGVDGFRQQAGDGRQWSADGPGGDSGVYYFPYSRSYFRCSRLEELRQWKMRPYFMIKKKGIDTSENEKTNIRGVSKTNFQKLSTSVLLIRKKKLVNGVDHVNVVGRQGRTGLGFASPLEAFNSLSTTTKLVSLDIDICWEIPLCERLLIAVISEDESDIEFNVYDSKFKLQKNIESYSGLLSDVACIDMF
ncbi:hypothetical protein L1887_03424 [Cichorium endivia]|nr:hypothetical protein L1887_03424 [Cichorium endivia]